MKALPILFAVLAFCPCAATAQSLDAAPGQRSYWRGKTVEPPVVLSSPLSPVPVSPNGARRVMLPLPNGDIPAEAKLPVGRGGGQIRLLVPWRDGWLVGTDGGEWGGALYTFESGKLTILANGPVIGGFTWRGSLYVLSGLRHMMTDIGGVWKVDLDASPAVRYSRLPGEPTEVVVLEDGRLILRTGQGDVMLHPGGDVSPVADR